MRHLAPLAGTVLYLTSTLAAGLHGIRPGLVYRRASHCPQEEIRAARATIQRMGHSGFCSVFDSFEGTTVTVTETERTITITITVTQDCTTTIILDDRQNTPQSETQPEPKSTVHAPRRCRIPALPSRLARFSCDVLEEACREVGKQKSTASVSQAMIQNSPTA